MFFSYFPFERSGISVLFSAFPVRPARSFNIETICQNPGNETDFN